MYICIGLTLTPEASVHQRAVWHAQDRAVCKGWPSGIDRKMDR